MNVKAKTMHSLSLWVLIKKKIKMLCIRVMTRWNKVRNFFGYCKHPIYVNGIVTRVVQGVKKANIRPSQKYSIKEKRERET